jgi:Cu/Zn superoxide dismutase
MTYELNGATATPYGDYTGEIVVSYNYIQLEFLDESGAELSVLVQGLQGDPACTDTSELDYEANPNACGLHIHENADCDDAGGHHYTENDVDPWAEVSYDSVTEFDVTVSGYNYDWSGTNGKALVFHDATGARIACTLISERDLDVSLDPDQTWSLDSASVYFNYEGDARVESTSLVEVGMLEDGSSAFIKHNLEVDGLDGGCTNEVCSGSNCCGIHIHEGTSCTEDAEGHYYDADSDPWVAVRYTNSPGQVQSQLIDMGIDNIVGRTLIVHDATGARIACYVLSETSNSAVSLWGAFSVLLVGLLH